MNGLTAQELIDKKRCPGWIADDKSPTGGIYGFDVEYELEPCVKVVPFGLILCPVHDMQREVAIYRYNKRQVKLNDSQLAKVTAELLNLELPGIEFTYLDGIITLTTESAKKLLMLFGGTIRPMSTSRMKGIRRPYIGVRLDDDGLEWIDNEAERRGLNRSEMIRLITSFSKTHLPKTWNRTD